MDSNGVFAMLFGSTLAVLVILFPSIINCCSSSSTGIRDAAGDQCQFTDSFHELVLDCSFGSSFHLEDPNITWEMSVRGFNSITGAKMALAFQDLNGNTTAAALSVCDLIGNKRVLVIICTITSYEASLIAGMEDDFITKAPTPRGEPILPKAKLKVAASGMYMVRHTSGESRNLTSIKQKLWGLPISGKVVRVGVPVRSNITQLVNVNNDDENHTTHITGFSIDVFEAAVRHLPYKFTYKLLPFDGSSDELVKKVAHKTFDVAVGDIIIREGHYQPVEFSLPYLEPGFMMVVKAKTNELNKFWWLLSPFTPEMWVTLAAFNVFIGAVIWIIESQDEDGPNFLEALFFVHREPLRNKAARALKVLWLFVVLMITQVYTSMLTTMLTNSEREPSILDADSVKWTNAAIGCDGQSQTISYLVKVLGFKRRNIRIIASIDDYAEALSSGNIKAAFLLTPYAKVFLAKHCADFTEMKPTYGYNLGGFGFVFPKGSPLASDISAAIVELEESGELQLMEEEMSSFSDCSGKLFEDAKVRAIGPSSFLGFFVLSGVTSAIALLIPLMRLLDRHQEGRIVRMFMVGEVWLWLTRLYRMLMGIELWLRLARLITGNQRRHRLQIGAQVQVSHNVNSP